MKGLKRTLLALGVAGLPAAAMADIVMLEDSTMGNITGQAGVSIELETKINMDRFIYTDEGSLTISGGIVGAGRPEHGTDGQPVHRGCAGAWFYPH